MQQLRRRWCHDAAAELRETRAAVNSHRVATCQRLRAQSSVVYASHPPPHSLGRRTKDNTKTAKSVPTQFARAAGTARGCDGVPWHKRMFVVIPALVFIAPLGISLIWMHRLWTNRTRVLVSIGAGIFFVLLMASSQADKHSGSRNTSNGDAPARASTKDECDSRAAERERWIDEPNAAMEGYSPSTFQMRAVGACATELRVRDDDCTAAHLAGAYGSKPLMRRARQLGFRTMSCGYDTFELSLIMMDGLER